MKAVLIAIFLVVAACRPGDPHYGQQAADNLAAGQSEESSDLSSSEAVSESTPGLDVSSVEGQAAIASINQQALQILQRECASCHSPANPQGNFGSVTQVGEMVASQRFIVPGSPDQSTLITHLAPLGNMPPAGSLPPEEISLLKTWIAQMRKPEIKPLSETAVVALIRKDLESNVAAAERPTTRYFTLHVPNNRKASAEVMTAMRLGYSKMINSISRNPAIVKPIAIDEQQLVYRLNLSSINMPNNIFDSVIADFYPYSQSFVSLEEDQSSQIVAANHAFNRTALTVERYLIRIDWFLASAPLPTLYSRLLRLGIDQNSLDAQLGVNVFSNIINNRVMRSGFKNSNVSSQNRVMERHTQRNGRSYWISYDFASNEGLANIFSVPLGPLGIGQDQRAFVHDGGEIIFQLPNGLFAYYLSDAAGTSIDKGPLAIVKQSDAPAQFLSSIVNGVSCMTCHNQGLIYKKDEMRAFFTANPNKLGAQEMNKLLALYPEENAFKAQMEKDNEIYTKALREAGLDPARPDPIINAYRYYNQNLTKEDVGAELGIDEATFTRMVSLEPYRSRWPGLSQTGGFIKRDELNIVLRRAAEQFKPNINTLAHRLGDMIFTPVCMAANALFTGDCLIELVRQEALADQAAVINPPPP